MTYSYQRTIHLADTDAAGVVYFAQLLHICHEAYEICLAEVGMDWQALINTQTLALPIVHAEVDFFKPIRWGDRLLIKLEPELDPASPQNSQFRINYQIFTNQDNIKKDRAIATAITHHVAIHPKENKRCELPELVQKWLQNAPKLEDSKN